MLASSKPPPADDGMRTSSSGRYGFGASAPLLMRAPPMYFSGAGGSAILPKLVKLLGPSSARAEELSPYLRLHLLQRPPYAYESLCQFLRLPPWRDAAAELDATVLLGAGFILFIISVSFYKCLSVLSNRYFKSRYSFAVVGSPDPNSS